MRLHEYRTDALREARQLEVLRQLKLYEEDLAQEITIYGEVGRGDLNLTR